MDNTLLKIYFKDKPILKTYVFGSIARNQETKDSDIDLLLELDTKQSVDIFDFIGWKFDLEKLYGRKVDLVTTDGMSKFIKPYIDIEKILVYEKQ